MIGFDNQEAKDRVVRAVSLCAANPVDQEEYNDLMAAVVILANTAIRPDDAKSVFDETYQETLTPDALRVKNAFDKLLPEHKTHIYNQGYVRLHDFLEVFNEYLTTRYPDDEVVKLLGEILVQE